MESIQISESVSSTPTQMESTGHVDSSPAPVEQSDGALELSGGSSSISFDEFEALEAHSNNKVKQEAKQEVAKEKIKDEIKGDKPEEKVETPKEEEESKKAAPEEQKEEAKESQEVSEEEGEAKETGRKYTVKSKNGRDIEIGADAKFTQRVDGVDQEVSLEEALNSWSGHKAVDQRCSQLNAEKQNFLEDKRIVDDTINEINTLADSGDYQGALITFFEKALKVNPMDAWKSLREGFKSEFEQMNGMSEAELQAHESQSEANFYKTQLDRQAQAQNTEAQRVELNSQIDNVITKNNLEVDTYEAVAEELITMKAAGKITQDLTPEFIASVAVYDRNSGLAKEILGDTNTDFANDPKQIDYLANLLTNGASVDDVRAMAKNKWGSAKTTTQALADKLQKTQTTTTTKTPTQDPQNGDIFSFDML